MKKVIDGKTYNTEYDSEFICKYTKEIDGWSHSTQRIYRKKSTGEYFEFSKWGDWNDSWGIDLISEEKVKSVLKEVKSGNTHKYCAVMDNFPRTRNKGYFWGTEDDDPWDEDKVKKKMEQKKKRIAEEEKKEEAAGVQVYGVLEITRCSEDGSYESIYDKKVPADKIGKVLCYDVYFRIKNSNFDKGPGYNGWYRYSDFIVLEGGDKKAAKALFMKIIDDVKKEMGEFEAVMKGGEFVEAPKNTKMVREIKKRIKEMNQKVIWGE